MPGVLSQLLSAEEPLFTLAVNQLELASGKKGTDAKLVGELATKVAEAVRSFGLDPKDTTGPEFYAGLLRVSRKIT